MTHRRDTVRAGLACVLLGTATACGHSASASDEPAASVSVLLVQAAASAEFDLDNGTLTLSGVDDETLWFTDRPAHTAGTERTSFIVNGVLPDLLADGDGAPNAALVWGDGAIADAVAIEIAGASFDQADHRIVYDVTVLADASQSMEGRGALREPPPGEIRDVHLFIDNIATVVSVCELAVLNESVEPFQVSPSDTHHAGETIAPQQAMRIQAVDGFGCSGSIHMTGVNSGATFRVTYHNPTAGANHVHMRCTGPITCSADRARNDYILREEFLIQGGRAGGSAEPGSRPDAVVPEVPFDDMTDTVPDTSGESDPSAPPTTD